MIRAYLSINPIMFPTYIFMLLSLLACIALISITIACWKYILKNKKK